MEVVADIDIKNEPAFENEQGESCEQQEPRSPFDFNIKVNKLYLIKIVTAFPSASILALSQQKFLRFGALVGSPIRISF